MISTMGKHCSMDFISALNPLPAEAPQSARDFLDPFREVAFASPLP